MRGHPLAVLATVAQSSAPQAALVGVIVTEQLEIVFDTLDSSRKYQNLSRSPHAAFVIGWEGEVTVQYEGLAWRPIGRELERYQELYFHRFPQGRERATWPNIAYFAVRPTWIRYSDYNQQPPLIVEWRFEQGIPNEA